MSRTAIHIEGLSKRYSIGETQHGRMLRQVLVEAVRRPFGGRRTERPSIWALKDVSLDVNEGEVVGIIGRNGAGKTTLLKVLSRITFPTSGTIDIRGRVASLVEVGTGFHQELTGRENVYLNGSILGLRKHEIDERFDRIVDFSGVREFIDTPVKRYSTGMRLRLGFAVAAHLSPDVLMVDEVLSVGDVDFQQKCLRALDEAQNSSRTVLFVSHNLEAVEQLCPRTVWIDHGRIRRDGPSEEVIREYLASVADASSATLRFDETSARSGTGKLRFSGVEFLGDQMQPLETVRSGEPLRARLHYEAFEAQRNPHFGIRIYSDLGALVTEVSTYLSGFSISEVIPGTGSVDVSIESLNLIPGRYFLSLWAQRLGESTVDDLLEHCAVLDVQTSDVFGTGRKIDRRHGLVYFPSRWEVV